MIPRYISYRTFELWDRETMELMAHVRVERQGEFHSWAVVDQDGFTLSRHDNYREACIAAKAAIEATAKALP